MYILIKTIIPINKIVNEVQKANINTEIFENGVKPKSEIGFLANQFNSLLDQVENNRKTFEDQVLAKTKEIQNKLICNSISCK